MKVKIKYTTDEISDYIKINEFKLDIKGVYLLYDKNKELLYIGKSKDIKSRIRSHSSEGISTDISVSFAAKHLMAHHYYYVRFFEINNSHITSCVEEKLISEHNPHFNLQYRTAPYTKRYLKLYADAENLWSLTVFGKNYQESQDEIYMNL